MIRVLQKTATLGPGGIQKFLINVQSNMDSSEVVFDYFLNTLEPNFFTETAKNLGSNIYGRNRNIGNPITKFWRRYRLFYSVLKKEKYSIVHIDETLEMTAFSVLVARFAGTRTIIAHSHNDHASEKTLWVRKHLLNPVYRMIISRLATDYFACSQIAAKWMFTPEIVESGKVKIINNGIQSELYVYNPTIEKAYREKLGLGDSYVLGHVGRFFYQKNHKFILDTFKEISKLKEDSILVLVGDGELKQEMESYAKHLGVYHKVLFYGVTSEVNKILQTFNAFIFPSRYEGLGIVAIEAQAASVQTFCAEETIAKEVSVTEFCHYIPLKLGPAEWAKRIIQCSEMYEKRNTSKDIRNANFDIATVSKMLEKFYCSKE